MGGGCIGKYAVYQFGAFHQCCPELDLGRRNRKLRRGYIFRDVIMVSYNVRRQRISTGVGGLTGQIITRIVTVLNGDRLSYDL